MKNIDEATHIDFHWMDTKKSSAEEKEEVLNDTIVNESFLFLVRLFLDAGVFFYYYLLFIYFYSDICLVVCAISK